jgi:bifunctional UDP-N-acetylglucosamine pyrophosphorylase/glucosamine-1-phosphate N-acetyltransferase
MQSICTIILAAGKGTRLKSAKPKVMHEILGLPLIYYPVHLASQLGAAAICVVGHGREIVGSYLEQFSVVQVVQDPPLGTGHAVLMARDALENIDAENVVILPGDMPLVERSSLSSLIEVYRASDSPIGVLTARVPDPSGYGRIVRDWQNRVAAIVEHNDADEGLRKIDEINTGVYIIDKSFLLSAVDRLSPDNAKHEFYLTDIVRMASHAASYQVPDYREAHGINSRLQLSEAAMIMQQRINRTFMEEGVTLVDPGSVWISPLARVGQDVEIWPHVHIMGECTIDSRVRIMPNTWIRNSCIGTRSIIRHGSMIENTKIPPDTDLPANSVIDGSLQS